MRHIIGLCALALAVSGINASPRNIPPVYDRENTAGSFPAINMPEIGELPVIRHLPDPFVFADGTRSSEFHDWERHRSETLQRIWHYETGEKPAVSADSIDAFMDNDTIVVNVRNAGNTLTLRATVKYPAGEGPFPAIIGVGLPSGSLPPELFERRDIAMIAFDFPQVMSHTQKRGSEPINAIYPDRTDMGAYTAWPWGISRIIDGIEQLGPKSRIDMSHIGVTGCSFAGKMALFAGAFDERIALVIAQEPGGGGVNAWRVSETLGEVETVGRTNYAWFKESMRQFSDSNVDRLPLDHHQLAALVAPRALLVLGNPDYKWLADESGYVSCRAAREVWKAFGISDRMGFSFQDGHPHCELPEEQHPAVEAFLDKFLLGRSDVDTDITEAPMFESVDFIKWMPWAVDGNANQLTD